MGRPALYRKNNLLGFDPRTKRDRSRKGDVSYSRMKRARAKPCPEALSTIST